MFAAIAIYKVDNGSSFFNPADNWPQGLILDKIADFFNFLDVLFSSLFSFLDYDEQKNKTLRFIVYFYVISIINVNGKDMNKH